MKQELKTKQSEEHQEPIIFDEGELIEEEDVANIEADAFDFGGLNGPKDFKKQLGCGG